VSQELPKGWVETTLGQAVDYAVTTKVEPDDISEDKWVLELEDIEKSTSRLLGKLRYSDRQSKSTKNAFESGDVLYGKLRPYLDKVIIADEDGVCTTEIIPIKSGEYLDSRFVFYNLKRKAFLDYVEEVSHGVNMPRLGTKQGKEAPFILAPLPEQIRIADKLDRLLASVNSAQSRLDNIPTLLKGFRQSVLAAATSGELTREWRGNEIFGKKVSMDELSELVTSGSRGWAKFYSDVGSIFIRSQDINRDELDLSEPCYVDLPDKVEGARTSVKANDLLITITGANVTKCARVKEEIVDGYVSQHVALIRLCNVQYAPYVEIALKSLGAGRKQLMEKAYGAGKPGLNLKNIRDVFFQLPELDEQKEIVRRVESLFALADSVEKQYQDAKARTDRLTQALLAKAFRGELVPQNPNDEPAEQLLARIQLQRAHTLAGGRRQKASVVNPAADLLGAE
jgi:type I restriction enzyme, S subunit